MNNKSTDFWAHAALAFVAILYGLNYFVLKVVFQDGLSSFAVLAIRCFVTALFFWVYHSIAIREQVKSRADYGRLAVAALFGVVINQTFFLWGVANTSRVNAAVLMILTPVFVFLAAWLLREERFTSRKIIGLIISFIGAACLILTASKQSISLSGASVKGDLMIMVNAATYGIYLVAVRPLVLKYHTFTIIKWLFLMGAGPNILIGIGPLLHTPAAKFTWPVIGGIAFLIIFATIVAYWLNAWAMKRLPSSAVGIYVYVQPIFVTLGSALFAQGEVSWLTIPFILLIFAGVWLVSRAAPYAVAIPEQGQA